MFTGLFRNLLSKHAVTEEFLNLFLTYIVFILINIKFHFLNNQNATSKEKIFSKRPKLHNSLRFEQKTAFRLPKICHVVQLVDSQICYIENSSQFSTVGGAGSTRHDLSCWWNVLCGSFREDFVHFQTNLGDLPYPPMLRADAKTYTHFQGCKMSFILRTANPQDDQFQNKLAQKL